ncbi:MAG TPA: OmpA family protein [Solimonas sp.]|nr:OmpA family protein [Solimonas sp.]
MTLVFGGGAHGNTGEHPVERNYVIATAAPERQTPEQAQAKSAGCVSCHTKSDANTMHKRPGIVLGCTDCHGGNAAVSVPQGALAGSLPYTATLEQAHVLPRYPETWNWPSSANPRHSYALLNRESPEFVRFVNPGDYRIARESCGACHLPLIESAERSLMATGAMLWEGASYNNGILPFKRALLGEAYTREGEPAKILGPVKPDADMEAKGVLEALWPLPTWETTPPGDVFRVFEPGGRVIGNLGAEVGLPAATGNLQVLDESGRPDLKQSNRGPGTGLRISVPVLNVHKTRLNDPLMWFLGTNDQPGDYRSSGCSACHVVYANDRAQISAGPYGAFGNTGMTQQVDPTIPKNQEGHPLEHAFSTAIPTSQCMSCHMHQPNIFVNSFLGYTMWDYESDAPSMWPEKQKYPSFEEIREINQRNPEEAAIRGKWGDVEFLKNVSELNPKLKDTQFADYHGHGWNFRAIFKRDRQGHLLDADNKVVANDDPEKFKKSVHMASIHAEKGMHCVDCHFSQDAHGDGHIYGEVAEAIEIECVDCHGNADSYPSLLTSGPAAPVGGKDLSFARTPFGQRRFEWINGKLFQRSNVTPKLEWEVSLVKDTVTPGHTKYNAKAARAKLMSKDVARLDWGTDVKATDRAHPDEEMVCTTCHTSWTTSCGGCHLPIQANWKTERQHYEGKATRNFATYNPQVARDDVFQLGRHGPAKGNRIAPVRSSSALVLSSTNASRERIYIQQPPVSASGFSSQAFAPHYPHTERKTETKQCEDCHLSKANDNNAIMAQLLLQGTNFMNFVGFNSWVGLEGALAAVQVTEWDEPQAVIGSYLQRYAYPDWFAAHQARGKKLVNAQTQGAGGDVGCLQLRGEYLYVAQGRGGFEAYDVASIANKGFSEKIVTAPFSPLGHDTQVRSKNATCVALPTNQPIAPERNQGDLMRKVNLEQPFHPLYNYALVTDSEEGLILVDINTLSDGESRNNFFKRALTWNEGGVLKGARHLTIAGRYVYVAADAGLVVLDLDDPLKPRKVTTIALPGVRASALQFRYLFATTPRGLEVVDVTNPEVPRLLPEATVAMPDARRVYLVRTYAYVTAGAQGLAIVDITQPERPRLYDTFNAGGQLNDASDVKVGATNASLFAYVADGKNGLKVIQLMSPDSQPGFYGFSPEPKPDLIAWYPTAKRARALSEGLHRDRAVDETGDQIAVFGRRGARPFTSDEMKKMYLDGEGRPWFVENQAGRKPLKLTMSDSAAPVRVVEPAPPPVAAPAATPPAPARRRFYAEIPFALGKTELGEAGRARLDAAAPQLGRVARQSPGRRIRIVGHANTSPRDAERNRRDAQARADAVRDYLVSAGVPREALEPVAEPRAPSVPRETQKSPPSGRSVEILVGD